MLVLFYHIVLFLGFFKLGELVGAALLWLKKNVLDKR